MWGTLICIQPDCRAVRFIPTYVGNSAPAPSAATSPTVHPHVCGELPSMIRRLIESRGSSPRMWGTRACPYHPGCETRFIPTYVGNSYHQAGALILAPVHPHVCGELGRPSSYAGDGSGSSPRMWGTLFLESAEFILDSGKMILYQIVTWPSRLEMNCQRSLFTPTISFSTGRKETSLSPS